MSRIYAIAALVIAGFTASAEAAPCRLPGAWNMFAIAANGNNAAAVTCRINIASNGSLSGTCTGYATGQPNTPPRAISGSLTVNRQCRLSGSMTVAGFATNTIRDGFLKGAAGTAIASQGNPTPTQVRLIQLMR
jgi:hypothetical protein